MRNFSPWASWQLQLAALPDRRPLPATPDELRVHRDRVRAWLAAALGPDPEPVPPAFEVRHRQDRTGYRMERVVFDTEPTMSVPALLLVPHDRTAPGPAVLAVHGHGPGKDAIAAPVGDGPRDPGGHYAHELAEAGYVVLAPDLRGFGDRAEPWGAERDFCDTNLVAAVVAGRNPLGQNRWDLARALDVLADQPLVDADRLGVVGFSYGGTMALFLAATDARVRAVVVSGYLASWRAAHRVPWNLCGSQVLPGMLAPFDHADVAALVAPRPMLVETATGDVLFPLEAARTAVVELRSVYHALGAPDAIRHHVCDGEHRYDGAATLPFLSRWLGAPR